VLNQCTHCAMAGLDVLPTAHGPSEKINSALYGEFSASAMALSNEAPFIPTEATASVSSRVCA